MHTILNNCYDYFRVCLTNVSVNHACNILHQNKVSVSYEHIAKALPHSFNQVVSLIIFMQYFPILNFIVFIYFEN